MTMSATASTEGTSARCPFHPEPYLRKQTVWKTLRPIADAIGDEVYYCAGNGSQCSWVYSNKFGVLVAPGLERPTPYEVGRIYQRIIASNSQAPKPEANKKNYGRAPWES